jgi:hypothetical protein
MQTYSHLIELAAVFGGLVAFCVWQLIAISHLKRTDGESEDGETPE